MASVIEATRSGASPTAGAGSARRDHYVLLGVARTESVPGLRAAYHERARVLHQGRGDEEESRAFVELAAAYEALSDPASRRHYDEGLRVGEALGVRTRAERPPAPPEPERLTASAPSPSFVVSLLGDPASITPSYEALRERLLRNFTGVGVPKSEHLEPLHMDVLLSPEEAAQGLSLQVQMPSVHPCPDCGGSGLDWGLPCVRCGEAGLVDEDEPLLVSLPARVSAGTTKEVPLEPLGIRNLRLCVHVAISG
jgi:molecular chaperone DnaJ